MSNDYSGKGRGWSPDPIMRKADAPRWPVVTTRNEFEEPREEKKVILQPRIRKGCKGCQNAETCAGVARGLFSLISDEPNVESRSSGAQNECVISVSSLQDPNLASLLEQFGKARDAMNSQASICAVSEGSGIINVRNEGLVVGYECGATGEVFLKEETK